MDIFNRLNERLDDGKPEGVTTLDIMELPRAQQQILLLMLRDQRAALDGVTLQTLTERFPNAQNLPETLAELSKNGWLISLGEPPLSRYKINLRRKRGAALNGIWTGVLDQLAEKPQDHPWKYKF